MKIEEIKLSVFEMPSNTNHFGMEEAGNPGSRHWSKSPHSKRQGQIHILHVLIDEGIEGTCTVGDARYTTMRKEDLEQLRILCIGEDPFDRERLNSKLRKATRSMFTVPGWFGSFDNCLWDIAGKVTGQPVHGLIGRARSSGPAYYNFGGRNKEAAAEDAVKAVGMGFPAVKDHFGRSANENIEWFNAVRKAVGPGIDLLHDAAGCHYTLQDAIRVGHALETCEYRWFEEPLQDRDQVQLQKLCAAVDIPILAPETLMNDIDLSAVWLISGATDAIRVNARHGTTSMLKLAHLAELHGTTVEMNGPGGLFGLVHSHLICAVQNASYYEYFPTGSRDVVGKEIGLTNPPVPDKAYITPPALPGWGAEWDWEYFEKKRVAVW